MIPKVIHYCWFGGNPKPELAEKCIASWSKYCSEYKIIEWNENNFDISSAPLYVRQAYENGKWAFVTDYVRLYAMINYGGIYMDTDVEVVKPLDDFLHHNAFSGFEDATRISTGIMACCKDFPLFKELISFYDNAVFINDDGTQNQTTNVETITTMCLEHGLTQNNTYQEIEGFALYSNDYFSPLEYETDLLKMTDNTVTIHWFSGSWQDENTKASHKKLQHYKRIFGQKLGESFYGISSSIKSEGFFKYIGNRIKKILNGGNRDA